MSSSSGSARSLCDDEEALRFETKYYTDYTNGSELWSSPRSKVSSLPPYSPLRHDTPSRQVFPSTPHALRIQEQADQTCVTSIVLHETLYLNGMRGLAAFTVFLCHLSYGTWDIGHAYGAAEPGQSSTNTYLLQLPIVRLFYSGPPMVAIFFTISGYALSHKPLQLMRARKLESFFTTLSSSLFRRAIRLFLPCFVSTFAVVCLAQLGLYKLTEEFAYSMRGVCEDHPWTAPDIVAQILDWMQNMVNFINLFDWPIYSGSVHYDRHLWTIPVEMRCSMALFLVHILVARMSTRLRISTTLFLAIWGTYWNRCDWVPFLAGAILAELDLWNNSQSNLLGSMDVGENKTLNKIHSLWWKYARFLIFVAGLYLASYPDLDGHLTPGYITLTKMIPERYTEKHRFWANIGATITVWSVSNIDGLRKIFLTSLLQWLGRISFPLYILHGPVIHTFGYLVMKILWINLGIEDNNHNLQKGFLFAASLIIPVTLWLSHIFSKAVDSRCIRFARWVEDNFYTL